jgi:hypothetical protein
MNDRSLFTFTVPVELPDGTTVTVTVTIAPDTLMSVARMAAIRSDGKWQYPDPYTEARPIIIAHRVATKE